MENHTNINRDNFFGAINGDILYLPLVIRPTETNPEVQKFVLKCEDLAFLGSEIDFEKFFKNLHFAINVEIADGYKGIQHSMALNGYSFQITAAYTLADFLSMIENDQKNQHGYTFGELDKSIFN